MSIPNIKVPLVEQHGDALLVSAPWLLAIARKLEWVTAPLTLSSPGIQGQIAYDQGSIFLCIKKDTWIQFTPGGGGGGGGITSVSLTMPVEFSVNNTGPGTVVVTKSTENPNTFWGGPTSGPPGLPSFRPITLADLPAIPDNDALANDSDVTLSALVNGDFLRYNSSLTKWQNALLSTADLPADYRVAGITIDGGSSSPSTGIKGLIQAQVSGTIVGWFVMADQVGTLTLEIDKRASSAPPSAPAIPNATTDKISASAPISLSTAQSASGGTTAVSTWTKTVSQWDSIQFNLTAVSTLLRVTVGVVIQRT